MWKRRSKVRFRHQGEAGEEDNFGEKDEKKYFCVRKFSWEKGREFSKFFGWKKRVGF